VDFGMTYTPEQEKFRVEVKQWLADNVPPDINARPMNDEESYQLYQRRRELGRRLGAVGWLYPGAPVEYGGGGLDRDSIIILEEETHAVGVGLPPYYDSGGLLGQASVRVWGTDEQKQRILPPIYRGQVRTWQLLSEPGAGSDLAAASLSAVRDGDHYVLNGQKVFVGSNHGADRFWILTMTGAKEQRHENLSWFMMDAGLPGITIQPQYLLAATGEGALDTGQKNTVYFENVRVPASDRIGGHNEGWKVASTHLEIEHGATGSLRENPIWRKLLRYCRATERDGVRLVDDPAVRATLAEIYGRLETVRIFGVRNYWMNSSGQHPVYEGSQLAYLRKTTGLWLTSKIVDIVGPYALTSDEIWGALNGHAEAQQRDGIVDMHPGGTTDIDRVIISRRLGLGKRSSHKPGEAPRTKGTGNGSVTH
jgi:alkylation response protein AidB-like acyl-CoA dehydrogenase